MAKSSRGKVIQMLSPENYIRQKARNLPIYECWVNTNWEESQMANIVIARQHTNGNITAGLFLVDLLCLGVKDTTWFFNISVSKYRENLEEFKQHDDGIEKIDYILAHNIVYAGIGFAEDYEFKPHKDFTSVSKYILDEDTDDIPLIEIECGIDGLPAFMQGPLDNDLKAKQVITQLERVAGPENYYLINEEGMIINDEDDFVNDDDNEDQLSNTTLEEKGKIFLDYHKRFEKLSEKEAIYFFDLHQSIVEDITDSDKYDLFYDDLFDEVTGIEVDENEIPDEMLGLEPNSTPIDSKVKELFIEIIENGDDLDKMKKLYKQFIKNSNELEAAADYLDLLISITDGSKKYERKLKAAAEKHPRYSLIQLKWAKLEILGHDFESAIDFPVKFDHYFDGRNIIHPWERFCYLEMLTHYIIAENDFNKLEAMKSVILELTEEDESYAVLYSLCLMFQIGMVADYFS